jgi:hypothetical protein
MCSMILSILAPGDSKSQEPLRSRPFAGSGQALRRLGLQSAQADLATVAAISNRRDLRIEWPWCPRLSVCQPLRAVLYLLGSK